MKALLIREYGGPEQLTLEEVGLPSPKSNEVLIKVHAAGVNPIDFKIRNGSIKAISGSKFPKVLGADVAGMVEQNSKHFRVGDKVFAMLNLKGGAYAEYVSVKESQLAKIPDGFGFAEAAAVPLAALTAFQSFKKAAVKGGSRVLINGASGGVGSFAVQIAKAMGAYVVGITSKRNVDLVRNLGADEVIDYTFSDFTQSTHKYDMVFDAVATSSFKKCKRLLEPNGFYITTVPNHGLLWHRFFNLIRSKKAHFIMVKPLGNDLKILAEWMAQGKLKPVIDAVFPLKEGARAHQVLEMGRTRGKLVLEVVPSEEKLQAEAGVVKA